MSKIRKISPQTRSDTELLEGLRQGENNVVSYIYKSSFPSILYLILANNGTEDEAKDIFQEAVMVLYDKVLQHDFILRSKISTFLYAVCRRLWLKQLRKRDRTVNIVEQENFEVVEVEEDIVNHEEKELEFKKMHTAMNLLGEPCKTILKEFYINNKSMKDICELMGYTSTDNAKTQKYKCLQRLKKLFFGQKSE
ncbi:MAG: RNA polymerase sigma factor [Sphingobacterium sp.]